MKLTYSEAYNKIIDAYFKDEIKPYNGLFCFCGTLAGTDMKEFRGWKTDQYSSQELAEMEVALLVTIFEGVKGDGMFLHPFKSDNSDTRYITLSHPNYEDALFSGMCAALEVLKEIHRARGENVDEVPEFKKRVKASFITEG